jgi:nitrite reductase/ring-hydroxylating ferredoxin subunit
MPEQWFEACSVKDLPRGCRKLVKLNGIEIALFNIGGFTDDAGGIKCPMHGWRFDLRDGSSERPAQATVYPVRLENNLLYLQL